MTVTFAGTPDRVESRLVPEAGFPLDTFPVSGLPRRPSAAQLRAAWRASAAPAHCMRILARRRPDVVLGAGGYVAGPMVLAARLRGIPAALTEADASACASPIVIPPEGGSFTGSTSGTGALAGSCGAGGTAAERVFRWTPSRTGVATVSTCGRHTDFDTMLYLRRDDCRAGAEVACNDDACGRASRLTPTVTAGTTYSYSAFAIDAAGNVSPRSTASATPTDVTPPGRVQNARRTDKKPRP